MDQLADASARAEEMIKNIKNSPDMFAEAEAIRTLVGSCGLTQEKVASMLSCSQSFVANKLRLLRLSDADRELILSGRLTERHARAALRIRDPESRSAALREMIARGMNVASAEEYVEAFLCAGDSVPFSEPEESGAPCGGRIELELRRRLLLRDMRIFYNSIDHAVDSVRACGFRVDSSRSRTDEGVLINILIKKGPPAPA
ncbi:MAG: hypothetical protein IJS78_07565 [Clostridia bacterium]|nr:hypothetical protein [Clostridia bacterium]